MRLTRDPVFGLVFGKIVDTIGAIPETEARELYGYLASAALACERQHDTTGARWCARRAVELHRAIRA